jgi:hypothetical protein
METARSSETTVYIKPTRRHIPADGILHSTAMNTSDPAYASSSSATCTHLFSRCICYLLWHVTKSASSLLELNRGSSRWDLEEVSCEPGSAYICKGKCGWCLSGEMSPSLPCVMPGLDGSPSLPATCSKDIGYRNLSVSWCSDLDEYETVSRKPMQIWCSINSMRTEKMANYLLSKRNKTRKY